MPRVRADRPSRRPARPRAADGRPRTRLERAGMADRALITLAEAATAGLTPSEMLDLVVAAAAALTSDSTVHLWLVDEERRELRVVAQAGIRPGKQGVALRSRLALDEGLAGAVARTRQPLVLLSLRHEPRVANVEWMRDQGFVSFAGVPFARADRLLGVLCVFTWERHRFTRHEVDLLRSFASHAAVALEGAALFESATSRLRRLETLREIEREISQQREPEALLGLIVRRAAELLEADSATLFLLDEGGTILRPHASYRAKELREIAVGEGVAGRVALRGEGMIVNDYPRSPYAIAPYRDQDTAVVAEPLLVGDAVRGVILVRRTTVDRPFEPADLVQLGDFAIQASIGLENVRLLRLASGRAERVKAAAAVGRLLASTLDADRILDLIAEKCREILGAEAFGLFEVGPDSQLRYVRGFGLDAEFMKDHILALGEGCVGKAAQERRSVQTADLLADRTMRLSAGARARVEGVGTRAILATPILIRAEVHGVLAVYHPPGLPIPEEETEFLEILANHAAAALENARLFAQTRRRQETAETLAALTQTLTGSLDRSTVLSLVADGVRRLLRSDGGAVGLVDPDGAVRSITAVGLGVDGFRDLVVRPGQGVGGRVLATNAPCWAVDDPATGREVGDGSRATAPVAQLAVPIRIRGDLVGVLWALYARPAIVTDEEIALGTELAQVVAIAVENVRLYDEARQSAAEARALFEVGRLIAATLDPDRLLDVIVDKVRILMAAPACGLFALDGDRVLRYARGAGLSDEFVQGVALRLGEGTSGRAVATSLPVSTPDILADPEVKLDEPTRALVAREGYRAVLSVPVWAKDAPYGCLATYWWEPRAPTAREEARLSALATLAAVALENTRLYAEAREHVERLERLNQVNRLVSASLRLDEVLGQVARAAASLQGAPLATVWVADEERRVLSRRGTYGAPDLLAVNPPRRAYGEGLIGWIAEHRQPLLDVPLSDGRVLNAPAYLALGLTSMSGLPILLGDRLLGILNLGTRRKSALTPADVALLQTLTGQAAVAIENARLYEAAQREESEAVALAEASRRFSETLRGDSVLDALVEAAERVLGQHWLVFLPGREPRTLRRQAGSREGAPGRDAPGEAADAIAVEAAERLAAQAAQTGAAILVRDPSDLPPDHPSRLDIERASIGSMLAVPLLASGDARAVVVGWSGRDARQFSERDVRLARALVDRAATALENARLFEELTRAYQELKTAQERLVQTEKLRALGEMASGVAHDFNNILAAVLGRVQLILNHTEDATLRRWLQIIERAALDGAQTVRQIQEFTRIRRDQPAETVDLNEVVRDAVEMTQTRWRDQTQSQGLDVRLLTDLAAVPPVDGHPAELRQGLTNLILNAVDALPHGGTITVSTRLVPRAVEVCVADDGIGMSDEVRRRIFEPFFTTKGPKGTGLGLAMVYGIVARHGGEVSIESREGLGSAFTIRLPLGAGHAEPGTSPLALSDSAGARVLVIDDEQNVRDALADLLRLTRHDVVIASHGAEGIEQFRAQAFDLVMTDLAMPGISGWQVAQAVKALRPEVPVVLVTGWGVELPAQQLRANGVDRVMTKPFRIDDVNAVVAMFLRRAVKPS